MIHIIHHVSAVQFNASLSERGLRSERNLLRVRTGTNVLLLFNAHLSGHNLQMLQWSDTDKMLLLLQFKEGRTGVMSQRCRFLMFARLQRSTAADKRAGWPLCKVTAQHALRGLRGVSSCEGGRHMFGRSAK